VKKGRPLKIAMPPNQIETTPIKDIEDLVALSAEQLTRLIQTVDERTLAVALRTASEDVKITVFDAMPGKASDPMNNTLGMLGRISIAELEDAQSKIVAEANAIMGDAT
jgi:flagellar motor switch protein FliG